MADEYDFSRYPHASPAQAVPEALNRQLLEVQKQQAEAYRASNGGTQPPGSPLVTVIADLGFALDEQARLLETLYERLENGGILVVASPQEPTVTQPRPQMSFRVGEVLAQFQGHVRAKNDMLRGLLERLAL